MRRILRAYGWLFAAGAVLFVLGPGPLTAGLNLLAPALPGARPLDSGETSLWLPLAGAMMAMISNLAFSLAEDPGLDLGWNLLLLSKATSTLLFAWFSWAQGNALFLAGALLDGSIFLHLLRLRAGAQAPADLMSPRLPASRGPFYEVWFAKMNDPVSRSALWLRYALQRRDAGSPVEASCWYVLFDAAGRKVRSGRWSRAAQALEADSAGSYFRLGQSAVAPRLLTGQDGPVRWEFRWESEGAPPFQFVPRSLTLLGLASSDYCSPVSLARFDGFIALDGSREEFRFEGARGSLGHLWGRRMADNWRWAHAVFPEADGAQASAFEILSAQIRLGGVLSPRLTTANLWHGGRHYGCRAAWRALANRSRLDAQAWIFSADLGPLLVEGRCSPSPLVADLEYADPGGRRLLCSNSKNGSMRLTLRFKDGRPPAALETKDGAAVEWVREAR